MRVMNKTTIVPWMSTQRNLNADIYTANAPSKTAVHVTTHDPLEKNPRKINTFPFTPRVQVAGRTVLVLLYSYRSIIEL